MGGQSSSHALGSECESLKQEVADQKAELSRLEKLVTQLQTEKASAEAMAKQMRTSLQISDKAREDAVAKSLRLDADKAKWEEDRRAKDERIGKLAAEVNDLVLKNSRILPDFLGGPRYEAADGKAKFHILRSFIPMLAAKFPSAIGEQIAAGGKQFYDGYFGEFFPRDDATGEVLAPAKNDFTPEELSCPEFDGWMPTLPQ